MSTRTTAIAILKGVAVVCLCLFGLFGLSLACFKFIFAGHAADEAAVRVEAVVVAIGTVGVVGVGLYFLLRTPRPSLPGTGDGARRDHTRCDACGRTFPSHYYLEDAGPKGYICSDSRQGAPDA